MAVRELLVFEGKILRTIYGLACIGVSRNAREILKVENWIAAAGNRESGQVQLEEAKTQVDCGDR